MDKVLGKLTVFFEEPFWVGCLNGDQRENYLCVRLRLGQNQKTMKFMSLS